jgi:hypothetical protein
VALPCPQCVGDATPNDGRKDGRCEDGAQPGGPCDAQSTSTLYGSTSHDCAPVGTSVGELDVDVRPMTTGSTRVEAGVDCKMKPPGLSWKCFCAGQRQPNACDSGSCSEGELCAEGPIDGMCSAAPFRTCHPGTGTAGCDAEFPGAGICENRTRPCFGESIVATGTCDPVKPTYVALFCTPPTRAPALNSTAGLPGPARLSLALERVN